MKKTIKTYPVHKHQYKYLYSKMLDKDLIRTAFFKMRKGKTKRKGIIKISNNLDYYVDFMYDMLLNSIPDAEHSERGFDPPQHNPMIIIEHGKERKIYIPSTIEQWVHHIIMQVLAPILLKMFHPDSYGSIPNKGLHRGAKKVLKYRHNNKYMFKFDVRHFFGSVRLDILEKKLREFIADDWFIHIIMLCYKWHSKGLPLGFYISQWLSNLYLNDLDYLIEHGGFQHVRYVDDIVIFGNNKRKIRRCFGKVKKLLGRDRLVTKGNHHLYLSAKESLSFLGFIFTTTQVRLRKKIAKNISTVAKRIGKAIDNKRPVWIKDARGLLSYMGWIKHSDGYSFYLLNVKPFVIIRKLKRIIGRRDKDDKMDFGNIGSFAYAA